VLVIQAMGRRIGFIPAAARLADPQREMPLQIYLAESGLDLAVIGESVTDYLKRLGRCIVVVSEGLKVGELGEAQDSFGHTTFGSTRLATAQVVSNYINSLKLPVPGQARYQIPGTDQRSAAIYASTVDLEEAYQVACHCATIARDAGSGWMGTILREPGDAYRVRYEKAALREVANSERAFPEAWISRSGYDVTDEFVRYAQPLIGDQWPSIPLVGGLQRFARLAPILAEKRLPGYVPHAYRTADS
jgi:6-phosphofructokinase 1